jgi:hypothetical protein
MFKEEMAEEMGSGSTYQIISKNRQFAPVCNDCRVLWALFKLENGNVAASCHAA